jgi:hypothetical protein
MPLDEFLFRMRTKMTWLQGVADALGLKPLRQEVEKMRELLNQLEACDNILDLAAAQE